VVGKGGYLRLKKIRNNQQCCIPHDFFIYYFIQTMKLYLTSGTVIIGLLWLTFACTGPEGPQGPKGDTGLQGTTGAAGSTGPQGVAGNANVTQINYSSKIHTGTADLFVAMPASVLATQLEQSLVYVYVKQNGTTSGGQAAAYWFSVPGETVTGNEYSFYMAAGSATAPGLFVRRVVAYRAGAETFDAVRVLLVQANNSINGRMAASEVDMRDYEAVRRYYNLPE
jgi:hypothetical protein